MYDCQQFDQVEEDDLFVVFLISSFHLLALKSFSTELKHRLGLNPVFCLIITQDHLKSKSRPVWVRALISTVMYSFCTNATDICECGIPWITISVNSFTWYLFEMTTTNDILIYLRTEYSQLRLCLPNRLWSILHIALHQLMALVRLKKPLLHEGCEYV